MNLNLAEKVFLIDIIRLLDIIDFWATENPHAIREKNFQNKFSAHVSCLIKDTQVRYFVYEDNLNTQRYLNIIQTVVADFLDDPLNKMRNCWYQLDDTPPHCGNVVSEELDMMFEDRWISV